MLTYGDFIKIIWDVKDTGVAGWMIQERDEHSLLRWSPPIPSLHKGRNQRLLFHTNYTRVAATDSDATMRCCSRVPATDRASSILILLYDY